MVWYFFRLRSISSRGAAVPAVTFLTHQRPTTLHCSWMALLLILIRKEGGDKLPPLHRTVNLGLAP
jgi:hypothetical protein